MDISLIIPTLNEESRIGKLVRYLDNLPDRHLLREILVVDGFSKDQTIARAQAAGATVLMAPKRGRAVQLNYGAEMAKGEVLYFVHADVFPPETCLNDIRDAISAGNPMGCFSYDFDSKAPIFRFNNFLTRFDWLAGGGGDQTFYIRKELFEEFGCYDETLPIMEDFDFVWRAKKKCPLHVISTRALVSTRKYDNNSWLKVQLVNALTFTLFRYGFPPERLAKMYKRMLG